MNAKIALLWVGAALLVAPASADFWRIAPGSGYLAEGISDNGVVSGGANGYFVWTDATGALPIGGTPPGNGVGGQGRISNDGTRISGTYLNPVSGANEAAYFDVNIGMWHPLGGIGGQSGTEISSGWSISGDGNYVVGLGWISAGGAHAIKGNLGGMFDLGSTVAGRSTRANGVDLDGNVVVGWQDSDTGFRQGAVWVDGVQELIFKTNGNRASEAYAVTNDGTFVTGIDIGGFFGAGFAYRYNTVTDTYEALPNLATGAQSRMAGIGITDDGAMIVGGTWGVGPATFGTGIIWREGIGTIRFKDYLDLMGVTYPTGYNFNFVSDVSSDGLWFTGWGGTGVAANESWVVYVPEPTGLLLLGLGGLALFRRR